MMKISALAAVLLIGTVAAHAQRSPGASENTPADSMKDNSSSTLSGTKGAGASSYAPGQKQTKPGGASELSPGDKMNDTRHHESR